jgi:AdoMet-dependent heme synthase
MKLSRMISGWPGSLLFRSPYTCNIKITTRCNLKCGFCGLWSAPHDRELHRDDYRYIADLLDRLRISRVVITGGEPLLRDDAPDIIALFAGRGISTTLLTNGTLLSPNRLKALISAGLHDIGISLDSLDPDRIEMICGGKNIWNKVVDAIRMSVDAVSKGIVEVLTTVTRENLHEIPDIVEFVNTSLGAWSVINPINVPESDRAILSANTRGWAPPLPAGDVDRVYDRLVLMKRNGARLLVSDRFLDDSRRYLKTGDFGWTCDAGERYFTIFPDGGLAPCSDQPSIRNIMEMTPGKFRSSGYRREVRDVQKQCRGCIFSCWREASYMFTDPSVMKERVFSLNRFMKGR